MIKSIKKINLIMKAIIFVFTLLVLSHASSQLQFQFGNSLARLVHNQGYVPINCIGGSGHYSYTFGGLPQGWTYSGNNLIIPNIQNVRGAYSIRARVTDSAGNVLNGIINLDLNGFPVVIQSGSDVIQNQINFQLSSTGTGNIGSGNIISGTPGSGNPGSGSSPSDLYSSYPGLPSGANLIPPSGNFPTGPSPSGLPSTPNPVPNVIRNIQATYSVPRDSNPISPNDVKRNSIFNRQLNANKAVANLISIIQQLTANVNAARNDIGLLEDALNTAELNYNNCNQQVFSLADTRAKIDNAIADRQNRLNDINGQINKALSQLGTLTAKLDQLNEKRTESQAAASPNAKKLADLEAQLSKCEQERRKLERNLAALRSDIEDIRVKIQTIRDDAAAAPGEITRIELQIPIVDRKILDLQESLIKAQREREDLLDEKERYRKIITDSQSKIREYELQITTIERRIPRLEDDINEKAEECQRIAVKVDEYRDVVGKNEANFQIIIESIRTQETLIDNKEADIKALRDSIKGLPNELTVLRNELNRVQSSLRRQYYICNDAADEVRKAKQNLQAINLKLQTETQWLEEANNNLERARAEKQLADIAVEEVIASSTSALPFSIVPNGNGQTNVGTPIGNNPSGSPLGPIRIRNEVDPSRQIIVGDISSYLSRAYGAGVDPSKPSTVSTVYPLSVATLQTLVAQGTTGILNADPNYQYPSNGIYGFGCSGGNSDLTYGQGTIYSVQPGMIQVRDQVGGLVNLRVGGCSNLEATQSGHILGLQDTVYYRGVQSNAGINLHSLTCVV